MWIFFSFFSKFRKWSASCFQSTQSQLKVEPNAAGASCPSRCLSKPPSPAARGVDGRAIRKGRGRKGVWGGPVQQHWSLWSTGASFVFKFLFIYFYFWLSWVFAALLGLSPVEASRNYPLAVVPRLLNAVSSLAVEHCDFKLANTGAA